MGGVSPHRACREHVSSTERLAMVGGGDLQARRTWWGRVDRWVGDLGRVAGAPGGDQARNASRNTGPSSLLPTRRAKGGGPMRAALWLGVMFAVSVLGGVQAGHAQWAACRADAEKFCADVQPGGGRILQCLRQHRNQLSPQCASHLEGAASATPGQEHHRWRQACRTEIDTYCADAPIERRAMLECLHKHANQLSASCAAALPPRSGAAAANPAVADAVRTRATSATPGKKP